MMLLLSNDAQLNMKMETKGYTALHCAAIQGHVEAVSLLLGHGVDPDARDRLGRRADGSPEMSRIMVKALKDVDFVAIDAGPNCWRIYNTAEEALFHEQEIQMRMGPMGRRNFPNWQASLDAQERTEA